MEPSHNRYYQYFIHASGEGLDSDEKFVPNLGQIYSYNPSLLRGRGQLAGAHRGRGFFGDLWRSATPYLKNLGSRAVDLVSNIAKDTLHGTSIKEAAIKNIAKTVSDITSSNTSPNVEVEEATPPPQSSRLKPKKRKSLIASSIARKKSFRPNIPYSALSKLS
jgi:hypothetical protein